MLRQGQRVGVRELASRFGVAEMTIRRDLARLQERRLLIRTHGGGVPTERLYFPQGGAAAAAACPEKLAIGRCAARLVSPGQTVMVDAGMTALQVARHLPGNAGITVVTTSLCVAQELFGSAINVLLLGGFLRKEFPSLYGPLTESALRSLHVDVLFIGCDGASSEEGFYTVDLHLFNLEQAMLGIADRVVLVTESAKFGRRAFARFAEPGQVHTLVTDAGLSPQDRANLEESGIKVVVAA